MQADQFANAVKRALRDPVAIGNRGRTSCFAEFAHVSNAENPDRLVAWQIRDMPASMRDFVTEQARLGGVKVPELLTLLIKSARDAGWAFSDTNRFANPSDTAAEQNAPPPVDLAGLAQMTQAALAAAEAAKLPVPVAFARQAMQAARQGMRQAKVPPS
jgi:hypothetical protein